MLVVIPNVLNAEELKTIHAGLEQCSFVDGKATAGYRAKRVKHNQQMDRESGPAEDIKRTVIQAILRNPLFRDIALPRTIRPPLISRYEPGMEYGRHVDDALMGSQRKERSDISMTVFLNDPASYQGGELISYSSMGEKRVKLPAGQAVVYPSSTLHRVAPVTEGLRLAAVTWVQSYVRDPAQRELLYDLHRIRVACHKVMPDSLEADLAFKSYSNLLRMWADT